MRRALPLLALATLLAGCGDDELLHGLEEAQANEILVALDEGGLSATKAREEGSEGRWTVSVSGRDAARAHRILAERELPRPRPAGFGEVFGKGSMVPTATEEHALYLHALSGELSRSVESIDGVVEARVHLGLPQPDPLRPGERPPPRGAVLVKCRPAACASVRALEPGIRALVAGAADGLEPSAISVVIAPGAEAPAPPAPPARRSPLLLGLAALAGLGGAALAGVAVSGRLRGGGAP
ncbi:MULTISPECIES: secretion protein [Anaeromyxobacter]|uniref:secretion protein n=1 Tax=Anaeromyxobacter TaxID=161492 RepID=UPI001F597766|nr:MULTISPECIES: secretion protein [unclassified Anaeromyxobacter]